MNAATSAWGESGHWRVWKDMRSVGFPLKVNFNEPFCVLLHLAKGIQRAVTGLGNPGVRWGQEGVGGSQEHNQNFPNMEALVTCQVAEVITKDAWASMFILYMLHRKLK